MKEKISKLLLFFFLTTLLCYSCIKDVIIDISITKSDDTTYVSVKADTTEVKDTIATPDTTRIPIGFIVNVED